ncbi:MAG: tetratricopeptide repeat protein [Bacillota bacterium]
MPRCWTCGSYVEKPSFRCPSCKTIKDINEVEKNINEIKLDQKAMYSNLSDKLSNLTYKLENITSAIRWGFSEMNWQLQKQNDVLKNIEQTLKSPAQTKALELKKIAEELMDKNLLDKAEEKYLESLEEYPLNYNAYIGLAHLYLKQNKFENAKKYFTDSIPHAPKNNTPSTKQNAAKSLMDGNIFMSKYNLFALLRNNERFNLSTPYQIILLSTNEWSKIKKNCSLKQSSNPNFLIGTLNQLPKEYITSTFEKIISNHLSNKSNFYAINIDNYLGYPAPKDYRSYSYRYLGHIEYCFNNIDKAVNYLSKACELSPSYGEALYDYSFYLSLTENKKDKAIHYLYDAAFENPLYFKLAQKEKSFSNNSLSKIHEKIINNYTSTFLPKFKSEIIDKFNDKTTNIKKNEFDNTILVDIEKKIDRCRELLKSDEIKLIFKFSDLATEIDYLMEFVMPIAIKKIKRKEKINKFMNK